MVVEDTPEHALLSCPKWSLGTPKLRMIRIDEERGQVWPVMVEDLFMDAGTRERLRGVVKVIQRETN